MKSARILVALLGATIAATAAFAAAPVQSGESSKGQILAGPKGMALYTFKNDTKGVSNCYDECAKNWPPLLANDDLKADGAYSIIDRKDGTKQWAKDGLPLYYWVQDKKTGDVTGDGMGGAWDVARP